jgi:hypothetical protein
MDVLFERCCGLDIHKRPVVACLVMPGSNGQPVKDVRSFGTMTDELIQLADWRATNGVTHVAMESTGVYWKPVWNLLEGQFELLLACDLTADRVAASATDPMHGMWCGPRGRLRQPFSRPGSGWRARNGSPRVGPASDRTVLAHGPASPPATTVRKGHAGRGTESMSPDPGAAPRAGGGRRPRAAPAATGCRRPRPARSSDPLARGGAPAASSSRGFACRSAACAPDRSGGRRPATVHPDPALPVRSTTTRGGAADTVGLASG